MTQKNMIHILELITWLLIAYISIVGYMYFFQRSLVFHPSGNPFNEPHQPYVPMVYETNFGLKLRGLWYPPQPGQPTIVFFQGNGGNIGHRLFKTNYFLKKGYGTALVGYRGYNGNPGQPTEEGLYTDARAAIRAVLNKGVREQDIILYGESLGTGVATKMATEFPHIKALILEAPYTTIVDVGAKRFWFLPVRKMMRDRFDNMSKIDKLNMPLLIVHGTDDGTIPHIFGVRLFEKSKASLKRMITVKNAGHNNLYEFQTVSDGIDDFLARINTQTP